MGKNISRAIKTTYKGRKFQSRLEQHLFQLFDDAGVKIKYEEEVFGYLIIISGLNQSKN